MAGTPVNPTSPLSAQNAPVSIGIAPIPASHPGFVRESPSGELISTGGSEDHKVDVSSTDTNPGFLQDKLVQGTNVTIDLIGAGTFEQLRVSSTAVSDHKVDVSSTDTNPGFLQDKIVAGAGLSVKVIGTGVFEQLEIDIITPFHITGFGLTGPSLVMVGTNVHNPAFAASYNQAASGVTLTDTQGGNDVIALPATAFISPHDFFTSVYGTTVTFTLHGTGPVGTGTDTANAALTWGQNVYTGSAVDPGGGGYNSAFVNTLAATLKLGATGVYAENAAAGTSVFFACLASFGLTTANFFVGGFPFACSKVATFNVTNNGVTASFDLFRSDNTGLGAFNLTVQ